MWLFRPRLLAGLALTATAAAAQAQSVNLYGLVDVGVASLESADTGFQKVARVEPGMMTTSFWGLKGEDDLGGGVKAVFKAEAFFRADNGRSGRFDGDTFFARDNYLGLSSDALGRVTIGRNTTGLFISVLAFNPFGDSFVWSPSIRHYFSGSEGKTRGDTGWSNSISYVAPSISGATFNLMGSLGEGTTDKNLGANVLYFRDALGFTAAYQTVEPVAFGGRKQKTWNLGATYDFKLVKLSAQYGEIKDDPSGAKDKISQIGAWVPAGPGNVLVSFGEDRTELNGNTKLQTASLGYNYLVSKRTDITAAVMNEKQEAGRSAFATYAAEQKGTSYGVNLRTRF
jgi:predicted porin